ncbi:MAG: BolA family protein [Gammaproteobacteria bacterium]
MDIVDESHLHAGHAGARSGRGHYRLRIVSRQFEGLLPLARHRAVYEALGEMMQTDIHALSIEALTPEETQPR